MLQDGWGDLLPAGDKGGVFDVESGGKAEAAIGDRCEELYVVFWCECGAKPLFVQADSSIIERSGGGCVDAHGPSGEGGVAGSSSAPQGLRDMC